jgi:acyl-coenzyme A synthetase/AMP-(fatty) acid ligase
MDFSRPATADPKKLLAAANDWQVTQAFASPAVWRLVGDYCAHTGTRIDSLRQLFSCGASVPASVLSATLDCVSSAAIMHTPYGATECLPVSTIDANEVLSETAARTEDGGGVCVGRKLDSIDWRVIRITDDAIATMDEAEEIPAGQIGELIVRGPQASPCYVTNKGTNTTSKITHQSTIRNPPSEIGSWHRMGDVGYLDERNRFWYCGRKSQRVETASGTLFTERVEAIFNGHPAVRRSALVGIGPHGNQSPVVIIEREPTVQAANLVLDLLHLAQSNAQTRAISHVLIHPKLPVDVRHNAKIDREKLAAWAAKCLKRAIATQSVDVLRSHVEHGNEAR